MTIVPLTGLQPLESIFDKQGAGMPSAQNMGGTVPIFSDILKDAIANVEQTQAVSQQDAYDLAMGKTDDALALTTQTYPAAYQSLIEELKGDVYTAKNNLAEARAAYDKAILSSSGGSTELIKLKRDNLGEG